MAVVLTTRQRKLVLFGMTILKKWLDIGENDYVATFDVEVYADRNNFGTYRVIKNRLDTRSGKSPVFFWKPHYDDVKSICTKYIARIESGTSTHTDEDAKKETAAAMGKVLKRV